MGYYQQRQLTSYAHLRTHTVCSCTKLILKQGTISCHRQQKRAALIEYNFIWCMHMNLIVCIIPASRAIYFLLLLVGSEGERHYNRLSNSTEQSISIDCM